VGVRDVEGVGEGVGRTTAHVASEAVAFTGQPCTATTCCSFDTPLWYGNEELQLLRGTTLWRAVELRRRSLEAQWKRLAPAVQELLRERLGVSGASLEPLEDAHLVLLLTLSVDLIFQIRIDGHRSTQEPVVDHVCRQCN
jgi:hypothetical protein